MQLRGLVCLPAGLVRVGSVGPGISGDAERAVINLVGERARRRPVLEGDADLRDYARVLYLCAHREACLVLSPSDLRRGPGAREHQVVPAHE